MKYTPLIIVVCFFLLVGIIGSNIVKPFMKREVRYNCELAEISPDFPLEVKEKCRELRKQK